MDAQSFARIRVGGIIKWFKEVGFEARGKAETRTAIGENGRAIKLEGMLPRRVSTKPLLHLYRQGRDVSNSTTARATNVENEDKEDGKRKKRSTHVFGKSVADVSLWRDKFHLQSGSATRYVSVGRQLRVTCRVTSKERVGFYVDESETSMSNAMLPYFRPEERKDRWVVEPSRRSTSRNSATFVKGDLEPHEYVNRSWTTGLASRAVPNEEPPRSRSLKGNGGRAAVRTKSFLNALTRKSYGAARLRGCFDEVRYETYQEAKEPSSDQVRVSACVLTTSRLFENCSVTFASPFVLVLLTDLRTDKASFEPKQSFVPEKAKRPRGRSSVRCLHESIQGSKFEYESGPKKNPRVSNIRSTGSSGTLLYASACKVRFKNATPDRGVARGRNCNRDKCVFCTSRSHASTGPMEFQKDVLFPRIDTYPNPNFHAG
uniref:Uncharacterized protein n=1 Tax=Vespula pensylvanica TaxID=30213 RepID=A0A834KI73_VESPE|nr:hypothetical protein H0235_014719 [Vespula pensylvanica]